MSFVAVVCKNDYPEAVTGSFPTRDEALTAGETLQKKLVASYAELNPYSRPVYFHTHVFEQEKSKPATIAHVSVNHQTGERAVTEVVLTERRKGTKERRGLPNPEGTDFSSRRGHCPRFGKGHHKEDGPTPERRKKERRSGKVDPGSIYNPDRRRRLIGSDRRKS